LNYHRKFSSWQNHGRSDDVGGCGGGMKNRAGEMESKGNDVQIGVVENSGNNQEAGGGVVKKKKGRNLKKIVYR
jgi:hypothetical protein